MTYQEVVDLLRLLRNKKCLVQNLRKRIEELRADYTTVSSSLSNIGMPHSETSQSYGKTDKLVDKVLVMEKRFEVALSEFLDLETKLYDNFYDLNEEEQYIILESYMSGKPAWKLGNELGYSEITIKRKRGKILKKICKVDTP